MSSAKSSEQKGSFKLTERDFEKLSASYISPELADQAGLFRVDSGEGARIVGRPNNADYSGIVFPYQLPESPYAREHRLRLDNPPVEQKPDGSFRPSYRYLSPPGGRNYLYFPPGILWLWLKDLSLPLIIVEGEKKVLAMWRIAWQGIEGSSPRFVVVGIPGVWTWKGKKGKVHGPDGERLNEVGPINDLDLIEWKDRKVIILFDSNVHQNDNVRAARNQLSYELHYSRGANVFHGDMPEIPNVNGPDDLAALRGPQVVLDIIENASPAIKPKPQHRVSTVKERIEKGAALRKLIRQAQSGNRCDPSRNSRSILGIKKWRLYAQLWAECSLEAEERDLLFTLHAMGEDSPQLEFFYKDLYSLLYKCDGTELDDQRRLTSTARQRLRRRFDSLATAEDKCGIRFIVLQPGRKDAEGTHPSSVSLLSIDYIEQIQNLAETYPGFARKRGAAMSKALKEFVQSESAAGFRRKSKSRCNPFREIENGWKRVEGHLKSVIQRMRQEGYEDHAIWSDTVKHLPPDLIGFILGEKVSLQDATETGQVFSSKGFNFDTLNSPQVSLDSKDSLQGSTENTQSKNGHNQGR